MGWLQRTLKPWMNTSKSVFFMVVVAVVIRLCSLFTLRGERIEDWSLCEWAAIWWLVWQMVVKQRFVFPNLDSYVEVGRWTLCNRIPRIIVIIFIFWYSSLIWIVQIGVYMFTISISFVFILSGKNIVITRCYWFIIFITWMGSNRSHSIPTT